MIYRGQQLTVIQSEMLVRTLIDPDYLPPVNSVAEGIWLSVDWCPDDIWDYIDRYVQDRPR
jgi:hypothetical protein